MNFQDVLGYAPLYEHPYSINTVFSNIKNDVGAFHPISDRLRDTSIDETNLTRFKVNVYAESSDDKYGITIGVVFFDNKPCIGYIISGRYGSDVDTYRSNQSLQTWTLLSGGTLVEQIINHSPVGLNAKARYSWLRGSPLKVNSAAGF